MWLQKRAFDFEVEIANAQVKQMLVAEAIPGKPVAHAEVTPRKSSALSGDGFADKQGCGIQRGRTGKRRIFISGNVGIVTTFEANR